MLLISSWIQHRFADRSTAKTGRPLPALAVGGRARSITLMPVSNNWLGFQLGELWELRGGFEAVGLD